MNAVKANALWQIARMDKPIGSLLLLWPTLWALFLAADGMPDLHLLIVFSLGVLVMRSAGCVINDYADRHFDGHVTRTQHRPLPRGVISEKEALIFFSLLVIVAFLLVSTLDLQTIKLSIVALVLAFVYPFMKRHTHLPQLVLGLAFSWAIPMAFVAQTGEMSGITWLLFVANVCWIIAYDTMYAMVDRQDDLQIGIKSTAILFGSSDTLIIGLLQVTAITLMVCVGYLANLGVVYFASLCAASALFVYQQKQIQTREPKACFSAFLNNNYVGMLIFAGIASSVVS